MKNHFLKTNKELTNIAIRKKLLEIILEHKNYLKFDNFFLCMSNNKKIIS